MGPSRIGLGGANREAFIDNGGAETLASYGLDPSARRTSPLRKLKLFPTPSHQAPGRPARSAAMSRSCLGDPSATYTICGRARTSLMHSPYPGRIATAGNLASPFTPLEIPLGQACEFNVYHLMKVDSPTALFPIQVEEIA